MKSFGSKFIQVNVIFRQTEFDSIVNSRDTLQRDVLSIVLKNHFVRTDCV